MRPLIETDRLLLRRFKSEDAKDCFEFLSDKETCHLDGGYEPFESMDYEYSVLMEKFVKQKSRYMIVLKNQNKVIGTINVFPKEGRIVKTLEIGYVISPNYRRQGYAFEALSMLCQLLLNERDADMLVAAVISRNTPSLSLIQKLGFVKEGNIHKGFYYPGEGAVDLESFYLERAVK